MADKDIAQTIREAQRGDDAATMELLRLLKPLLIKYSTLNGKIDDDLHHYLLMRILKATKDFRF